MFYHLPPTGVPITSREMREIFGLVAFSPRVKDVLKRSICRYFNVKYCYLVSSGSAALVVILRALSKLAGPDRNEVVIPAYTCFSVPSAIVKAGLYIKPCDINTGRLDFDPEALSRLDLSRALCVVPSNLFGLVTDWDRLSQIRESERLFLVDDAAQSMGATLHGRHSGTFGDVGFFSLGRGKNITAVGGGIIVTSRDDVAQAIDDELMYLRAARGRDELLMAAKFALYALFLHPRLYWIPESLPFLELGETTFDPDINMSFLTRFQESAGSVLFENLERLNDIRRKMATSLKKVIDETIHLRVPEPIPDSNPAYLRLPLLTRSGVVRDGLITSMRKAGVGASEMYPSSVHRIDGIWRHLSTDARTYPNADEVADCLLTLPTHPYVTNGDLSRIIRILREEREKG